MRFLLLLLTLLSLPVYADFGWMPPHKSLYAKLGVELYSTSENYGSDGALTELRSGGEQLTLSDTRFFLEPEYGIAPDWAARLRLNIISNSVTGDTSGTTYLDGGGLGDILVGIKYRIKPSVISELTLKFPTYSNLVTRLDELLPGDGSVDVKLAVHFSTSSKQFFFAGTPAFTFRSGGFSPLLNFQAGAGVRFAPAYGMVTADLQFPMGSSLAFDSTENFHDAAGTGSSYARLSGSPSLFTMGIRGGVRTLKNLFLEISLQKSMWGNRAPNFFQFGINLMGMFEFAEPDTRKKIRQIPFESSQDNPPPADTYEPIEPE